jgi:hypothetical protein
MSAQSPTPTDGREAKFEDALLDKLVGNWRVVRKVRRWPHRREHRPGRLGAQSSVPRAALPSTSPRRRNTKPWPSSASITKTSRYVLHWLDVFGGRASEVIGYGTLDEAAHTIYFTLIIPTASS